MATLDGKEVGSRLVDRAGRYVIALRPGTYQLSSKKRGPPTLRSPTRTTEIIAGLTTQVDLTLTPVDDDRATLRVRVRRPSSEAAGAGVYVVAGGDAGDSGSTNANGRVSLRLAPRHYSVRARDREEHSEPVDVELTAAGADIELVVAETEPLPRCSGLVVDEAGEPVADARPWVGQDASRTPMLAHQRAWLAGAGSGRERGATSDLMGRFELTASTHYARTVYARKGRRTGKAHCEDTMTVRLTTMGARATVSAPAPDATVHVIEIEGPVVATGRLDRNGKATLDALPAGRAAVVLDIAERAAFEEVVLVRGETTHVTLEPRPLTPLIGRVIDAAGRPVANEYVSQHDPIGEALSDALILKTDAAGRFEQAPGPRWPVWLGIDVLAGCGEYIRWAPGDGPIVLQRSERCTR